MQKLVIRLVSNEKWLVSEWTAKLDWTRLKAFCQLYLRFRINCLFDIFRNKCSMAITKILTHLVKFALEKIVNGQKPLTILIKSSIFDVRLGFEYASAGRHWCDSKPLLISLHDFNFFLSIKPNTLTLLRCMVTDAECLQFLIKTIDFPNSAHAV